jgi:septal ring-binding cell division protein DamX
MPLTEQEKLLLRFVHKDAPVELAMLGPKARALQELEDKAEFQRFFGQSMKQAVPEQSVVEQGVPGQSTTEQVTQGQSDTSRMEQAMPVQLGTEGSTPEQAVPEQAAPEQPAPEQPAQQPATPEKLAPDQSTTQQATPRPTRTGEVE